MFTIYSENGSESTMVSNLFIDEYMNSANDAQIKIYLYLLRMIGTRRTTSISDLADRFNHTEKDVVRSLRYWERRGLLNLTFNRENELDLVSVRLCSPCAGQQMPLQMASGGEEQFAAAAALNLSFPGNFCGKDSRAQAEPVSGRFPSEKDSAKENAQLSGSSFPGGSFGKDSRSQTSPVSGYFPSEKKSAEDNAHLSGSSFPGDLCGKAGTVSDAAAHRSPLETEALAAFRKNPRRAQLLFVIEQYIGKPLSLREVRIIFQITENLHFSDDLTDYLVQFCVDRGKKDFRYIREVAQSWFREGVRTPAQAESFSAKEEAARAAKKARDARISREQPCSSFGTAASETAYSSLRMSENAANASPGRQKAGNPNRTASSALSSLTGAKRRPRSSNVFNQFEQNSYDFDALESELLGG